MKAAILHAGGDLRFETFPDPAPGADEVVLKVHACSICGSDLHAYHGKHPRIVFPRVLGHEFAGEIVAVGSNASGFRIGERVCSDIDISCGACGPCGEGRGNICDRLKTMGFDRDGAYAEFVATPAKNVYRLPDNVSYDQAAIVQTLGISYHAVAHRLVPAPGETVCVIGAGPIGLGAALVAKSMGARVAITDLLDYRLDMARGLGIDLAINVASADLKDEAMRFTGGRAFDKVVECVGGFQEKTVAQAISVVKRGGLVVVVGTFPENKATIPIAYVKDREIDLKFSRGNFQAFGPCLDLIARRDIDPEPYISHRLPLARAEDALLLMEAKGEQVHKIVLQPQA